MDSALRIVAIVVSLAVSVVALALVARAVASIVKVIRLGQRDPSRSGSVSVRVRTMLTETLGHTRMVKWHWIGIMHWFVFVGFGALVFTLITAFGQIFSATWHIPSTSVQRSAT